MLQNKLVQDFLKFCIISLKDYKQVTFNEYPKLTFTVDKSKVQTLASFNPSTNEIICYTPKRLVADVFRSIAHELVHFAQNVKQELSQNSGETGSDIENEANALAGIIMRDFGKRFPQIFVTSFDEMLTNKSNNKLENSGQIETDLVQNADTYLKSLFPITEKKMVHPSLSKYKNLIRKQYVTTLSSGDIMEEDEDKRNYLAQSRAGFRAGHIEGRKPEDMLRMDSNRHTGHFGTGFYFFGDSEQADKYSKSTGNRDVRMVDFNDYRLFVPNTEYDGFKLHDFFKKLNNNDYPYQARKLAFDLITSDRISIYLREHKIDYDRYALKDILYSKDVFEQYFYDSDKSNVVKEFGEDERNISTINGVISYVDKVVRPQYKINLNQLFSKDILPTLSQLNKNKKLSQEQIANIAKLIFSDYRIKNHSDRNNLMGGKDTLSTRIMKYFGWEGIDVRGMKGLDNSEYGSVIYDIKPSSIIKETVEQKYDYGCLMLDLTFKNWDKFVKSIPEDKLYKDGDKYGREFEPHCTVLYGFVAGTNVDKITKSLNTLKNSIKLSIDKIDIFENDDFDVVKFNVVSEDLHKLHKIFSTNFKNEEKFPEYKPHVTIAYVKKGFGKEFVKTLKEPLELSSKTLTYSEPNDSKHIIELNLDKENDLDELNKFAEYFLTKSGDETYENFDKIEKEFFLNECDCDNIEDEEINELINHIKKQIISEAQYQGKTVTLNKPTQGDVKKFKVFVKNKSGKVVKVNFGSKEYNIKKNNPDRKKSYCARSKGIEGGGKDKTKANYWSRRMWKC